MSLNERRAIYTAEPTTQISEILVQPPEIPKSDLKMVGGLQYALDYKTISTTVLTNKDIRTIMLNLNAMVFDEMVSKPPLLPRVNKALDNNKLLSFITMKRSQNGFMLNKIYGAGTSGGGHEGSSTEETGQKKKRFWRW